MEREHRYYVAKKKDVEKYLSEEHQLQLDRLLTKIRLGRLNDGKADVQTVCVDSDWPEYETVWKMLEARVDDKTSPASAPVGFVLVPVELTPKMIAKVLDVRLDALASGKNHNFIHNFIDIYKAMLAVAPTPPVSEDAEQEDKP